MKKISKTKNNIIIIAIAVLSALIVILIVLITGFSGGNSGQKTDAFSSSSGESYEPPVSEPIESSEPAESSEPVISEVSVPSDSVGGRVAALARELVGSPFVLNGQDPAGFDNSGFIYYVLRQNGFITCPRTTEAQSVMGERIGREEVKEGDLVFFGLDGSGTADFGGIYIGDGKMIACLNPDTNVVEVDITTDYYTANFYGGIGLS